uniref:Ribonucleases G and E n=1 Tax=Planktothrix paucivesiculata PCC 9631 TaxID=671071 RepID=A0A0K0PDI2_9CYAN|nr:ribonucleases G and E [Planktothrix paucivesiculata PCC 9631]
MSYPQQFPPSLLTQSPEERLAYFDNYTMAHPRLDEAVNLLKLLVNQSGESRVIFIYGPTGVGKTTLRLLIEKWLIESTLEELETNPGCIPVASVEAVIQKSGLFNSKDHIKRCLFLP